MNDKVLEILGVAGTPVSVVAVADALGIEADEAFACLEKLFRYGKVKKILVMRAVSLGVGVEELFVKTSVCDKMTSFWDSCNVERRR